MMIIIWWSFSKNSLFLMMSFWLHRLLGNVNNGVPEVKIPFLCKKID